MRLAEISSIRSCVSLATWRSSQSGDPPACAAPEGVVANIEAGLSRRSARRAASQAEARAGGSRRGQRARSLRRALGGGQTRRENGVGHVSFARTSSDRVRRERVRSRRTAWRPPLDREVAGLTRTRGARDGSRVTTARARVAPRVAFEFVSAHSKKELSVPTVRGCHASRAMRQLFTRPSSRKSRDFRHSSPRGG